MLAKEGWVPNHPLPLGSVQMRLREITKGEDLVQARKRVRACLPSGEDGTRVATFSEAMGLYDRPQAWFNGRAYRLLEVARDLDPPALCLTFGIGRYFDGLDTSEYLGHEAAARSARGKRPVTAGPYRQWLSDPFDLTRRAACPGISALTIRRSSREAHFFMHRRDPDKVAVAMNATNVTPAGEFQPHDDVLPVWRSDLDIWRSVMREYAEEFLGLEEFDGSRGTIIDYEKDEPFRRFVKAERDGDVTIRFLGLGLDPLNWKPEICVACIWADSAFDRIFSRMVQENNEGVLVVGPRSRHGYRGLKFNAANVLGYAAQPTTYPPGRTCLTLAWQWRYALGLTQSEE